MFLHTCGINGKYKSLKDGLGDYKQVNNIEEWVDSDDIVLADLETGLKLMNKVVFTHIPFGPYNSMYVFIKR